MKKKNKKNARKDDKGAKCLLCNILDGLKDKMDEYSDIVEHFSKAKREALEGFKKIIDCEMISLKKKKKKKDFSKVKIDG